MQKILEELGLTRNEIKVYLTLVNQGTLNVGKLTSKCGVHRRSVYDALDRLIEKGIVGYIKVNNVKEYSASNPRELLNILKRKEENVLEIIPRLEQIYNLTKAKKETVFFKGKEGIKHIFEDQLKVAENIQVIGGSNKVFDLLKYYLPHYERERVNKKIKIKLIFDTKEHTRNQKNMISGQFELNSNRVKIPLSTIKYVEYSLGPSAINIYGNKVAIIVWSESPYAILIDDGDVANSYRQHFELIWGVAK